MAIFYSSEKISDDGNRMLNLISQLWDEYVDLRDAGTIPAFEDSFPEFLENEWLERVSLNEFDDDNPEEGPRSTSWLAGKILGEI
jgi:hypothetical protein